MTVTPPSTPTPYSIGAIEGAAVTFAGSAASALLVVGETLEHAAILGVVSAAIYLGYHAYQSS